ncbi:hypothetical protein BS17DRAFT_773823 [Gyrodon lividus]|nr:hypothetical protein BS17DRAFT_773823 [Gyrodon lividus]
MFPNTAVTVTTTTISSSSSSSDTSNSNSGSYRHRGQIKGPKDGSPEPEMILYPYNVG